MREKSPTLRGDDGIVAVGGNGIHKAPSDAQWRRWAGSAGQLNDIDLLLGAPVRDHLFSAGGGLPNEVSGDIGGVLTLAVTVNGDTVMPFSAAFARTSS